MQSMKVGVALVSTLWSLGALAEGDWTPLLDESLSEWRTYLGYPNPDTEVTGLARADDGEYSEPMGYDRDELGVFSVTEEGGEPVLRISGEIYGGIFTRKDFSDYRLRLQFKWGEQKWAPREDRPLDSGILYHGTGEHGVDYWRAWPLSQEFQIVEQGIDGLTGDWWKIAYSQIDIRCASSGEDEPHRYHPELPVKTFGGDDGPITCRAIENHEKPSGEWNTLELIAVGDKSLHIVNGEVVMALSGSAYPSEEGVQPLTEGQIVLQSEAGEVFYRRIEWQPQATIPSEYQHYFK